MNDFALRGKWPDVTFLLDISHAEMLKRGRAAGTKLDYMESLGPEFFERVIAEYRDLAATHPERVKLIDGTLPPQVIFDEHIKPHIEALYRE